MRFQCEVPELMSALNTVSRALAVRSTMPVLEGILLESCADGLRLMCTDMALSIETVIPATVEEEGRAVMPGRLFLEVIRKLPNDTVSIQINERHAATIRCQTSRTTLSGMNPMEFPELPEIEGGAQVSIPQNVLRDMITKTSFAIGTDESRPILTGALMEIEAEEVRLIALDGFRLAVRREPLEKLEGGAFSFVAPGNALNEVKGICSDVEDLAHVTLGKRHILFEVGDTELICRRLEGEFLDYKNAIPRKNPIVIEADTKALIESIDRVSVVISDKLKSPVRCLFDHDKVMLMAKTGNGEAKDICRVAGDGEGLEIGFNNRYLMEALRFAPADTVRIELNTGVSPAIIVPTEGEENFLYMVLPVRLKNAD